MTLQKVGVFGAASLEGESLLEALADSDMAIAKVEAYGDDGEGETVMFRNRPIAVQDPASADFSAMDLAIFLPGCGSATAHIDAACDAGIVVVDASDTLAQRDDIPLYCDGDEPAEAKQFAIADGASSHVAALLAKLSGAELVRIDASIVQAVSVTGRRGIEALASETARLLGGQSPDQLLLGQQIAFNVLPQSADRVAAEFEQNLSRLLSGSALVNAQVMMAPVFYGHTIMLRVECANQMDLSSLRAAIASDTRFRAYPTEEAELATPVGLKGSETIDICDLYNDRRDNSAFRCTLVGDNLRKGAVFNIISLLKILIKINI
jgi:aspartate-semialdehyde dehydrogenase